MNDNQRKALVDVCAQLKREVSEIDTISWALSSAPDTVAITITEQAREALKLVQRTKWLLQRRQAQWKIEQSRTEIVVQQKIIAAVDDTLEDF